MRVLKTTILSGLLASQVIAAPGLGHAQSSNGAVVHDLPYADGKSFSSLDSYLSFLKERGAMDLPWYLLEPDGRFRLVAGPGSAIKPQYFTRAELMAKFGFSK